MNSVNERRTNKVRAVDEKSKKRSITINKSEEDLIIKDNLEKKND